MENDKILNSEQSLELIHRMIKTAQHDLEDDSFYFLLWGWAVFAACTANFVLLKLGYAYPFIGWMVLMPLSGIVTGVYGSRRAKKVKVTSYVDSLMKYVLVSFLVSLFIVLFFMSKLGLSTYPMVMVVYGFWLFISGGALEFRPLKIGGAINWVLAAFAFFVGFEQQLIVLAIAVLLGYIIPGHMLKNKFKSVS
ncbi:MAG: hypothetical protein IPN88_14485 [Bacteroidetes bacterium]|nr:hypothetical protein [Bacteroidota bacterium]